MSYFFRHWLSTALALSAASWVLPGVEISSLAALMVAALVLGCANAVVKPMLLLLTLPITILTLGFFYVVVNGLVFALAAFLVPGFSVRSFVWAMLGAFIVGFVSWLMGTVRRRD